MIRNWLTPLLLGVLVTGCSSVPMLDLQQHQGADSFITHRDSLFWNPIEIPTQVEFLFDNTSQILLDGTSVGPVAGFVVPGNRGSLDISLSSFVSNDLQVYAPTIVVFDSQDNELYKKSFHDFKYYPAKLLDNDKFVTTFNIIPETTGKELKILIYTTVIDLAGKTQVLHPAKAHALARHTQPPDIADPYAKHSLFGHLRLNITANDLVSKHLVKQSDNRPQGQDLATYYHTAIQQAVAANDIPKALGLLDEAKALGIDSAQAVFVKAVNSRTNQ